MIITGDNNAPNAIAFIKDNYFRENPISSNRYKCLNSTSKFITNRSRTKTSSKIFRSVLNLHSRFSTIMIIIRKFKNRIRLLVLSHSNVMHHYVGIHALISKKLCLPIDPKLDIIRNEYSKSGVYSS